MSDHKDTDQDHFNENIKYTPEDQSRQEWDNELNNIDELTSQDNDPTAQKLWLSFQTSATSTAQLYKGEFYLFKIMFNIVCSMV